MCDGVEGCFREGVVNSRAGFGLTRRLLKPVNI